MKALIYFIKCISNLTVGSGESNFSIIDNEVEKDPITGYPTVNGSSLKGAFRAYFLQNNVDAAIIDKLFGAAPKTSDDVCTRGAVKFMGAQLLARPARTSTGENCYYMVTSATAINQFSDLYAALKGSVPFALTDNSMKEKPCGITVEGCGTDDFVCNDDAKKYLREKVKSKIFIMNDMAFAKIPIPVVARNQLENGESNNLWYEEYVPHESIFYFAALAEENDSLIEFDKTVNGKIIQIGGNATVGCGICRIEREISNNSEGKKNE